MQFNDEDKEYCLISKEVLILLDWLLSQDTQTVEKFIKKAWKNGLYEFYQGKYTEDNLDQTSSQKIVFYFFSLLDDIVKKINKNSKKKIKDNNKENDTKDNKNKIMKQTNSLLDLLPQGADIASHEVITKEIYKTFLEHWNPKKSTAE